MRTGSVRLSFKEGRSRVIAAANVHQFYTRKSVKVKCIAKFANLQTNVYDFPASFRYLCRLRNITYQLQLFNIVIKPCFMVMLLTIGKT